MGGRGSESGFSAKSTAAVTKLRPGPINNRPQDSILPYNSFAGTKDCAALNRLSSKSHLHHRAGVSDVERERGIRAAAGISADGAAVAIVIDGAWMFGIDQASIFVLHQFLHH